MKPVVGLLSVVPRLNLILSAKVPDINFIDVKKHGIGEIIKANNMKVLIADSDVLSEVMYDIPGIEWVQGTWAGFDKVLANYDPDKLLPYVITRNAGPHFGSMMAEYVVTNLVVWERNYRHAWNMQQQQIWDRTGKVADYQIIRDFNKISILGVGVIGKYVASVLRLLGASQIWGLVQNVPDVKPSYIDVFKTHSNIKDVLDNSNVIINTLPGTNMTSRLLNMKNLSVCKNAVFINCGRGTIISEADIIEAINKNYFSAAIIDVFVNEPLRRDSPLWKMKQVIITPHVAAMPRGPDVAEVFSKNWPLWVEKKPLPAVLDFTRQY